jgi:hypothetical protein
LVCLVVVFFLAAGVLAAVAFLATAFALFFLDALLATPRAVVEVALTLGDAVLAAGRALEATGFVEVSVSTMPSMTSLSLTTVRLTTFGIRTFCWFARRRVC